ncbi:MAG TPA: DUF4465 domain-containing protein [Chitinophagales bacterium]|nr:DUF4465 domain-containing protein [Chitinophagales bacterium]
MKKFNVLFCLVFFFSPIFAQTIAGFENPALPADSFWNGSDLTGGFASGNAFFSNDYNVGGGYWSGFSYSNKQDVTTSGAGNQYSAITGGGYGGSTTYAVANDYGDAKVRLTNNGAGRSVKGFYVTNATYAYLTMKNGDMFAKKFGGATGTDPDWFRLNVTGWKNGAVKSQKVEFYLADFRGDSAQDYILNNWAWVDLQPLGNVDSLVFHLESTDTAGGFGMNNPAYFVMDNFETYETLVTGKSGGFETLALPVDSFWNGSDQTGGFSSDGGFFTNTYNAGGGYWNGFSYSNKTDSVTSGSANQYSAITAKGVDGSNNYAIGNDYGNARIILNGGGDKTVKGFYVTNATYAYTAMRDGDMFAKKFGGPTGNDEDWFKLTVFGYLNGALKAQSVDFYLADFRDANNANDYIVGDWRWVDLQPLGDVDSLEFHLSSTDTVGGFGMNNPAYFAMDDFTAYTAPSANDDLVTTNYLNDTIISVLANDNGLYSDPFTVELIGSSLIAGSAVSVIGNEIHYKPAVGIIATDTLVYRVYDALGNADTAKVTITVTGIAGIDDVQPEAINFVVYPNPFAGSNVTVATTDEAIGNELAVYDLAGRLMSTERITSRFTTVDAQNFASGIYMVKIGGTVKKIVKQ